MDDNFLTQAELIALTGAQRASLQAEVLRAMGLNVWPNRAGKIMLAREALVRCQLGSEERVEPEPKVRMVA